MSMQGSGLEWRLESGALLRCWKPYKGDFFNYLTANSGALGMHHYEGVVGAERLVSIDAARVMGYHVKERRPPDVVPPYKLKIDA